MEKDKTLSYIHTFMCELNFIILFFVVYIMCNAIYRICSGMEAQQFLSRISTIPQVPWKLMWRTIISYALLLAVIISRRKWNNDYGMIAMLLVAAEIILCIAIIFQINMSYDGVILLVIADLVNWFKEKKQKQIFFAFMIVLYIVTDYNLISNWIPIVSFEEYLFYYNRTAQGLIKGTTSTLTSLNIIVFILYMIISIQNQRKENERIQLLNQELNDVNEKLQDMNIQLKDYAAQSEKMAETRERNRLAREIHDTLGHSLTGICAGIDACIAIIDTSPEITKKQLVRIGDVARKGIKDVRRSVSELRPDALERKSLQEALAQMVEDTSLATDTGIVLDIQTSSLNFNSDEEDVVYRIVQEGITNAIRHGHATKIHITISKKDQWLTLVLQDNGMGCQQIESGFGLKHMQERIELLNGNVFYDGSEGFTITARIPIRWGE